MAIATRSKNLEAMRGVAGTRLSSEQVWHELDRGSFAILGYVTPSGEPRSSGVLYKTVGRRLFTVVAPASWKARHIARDPQVSVTVPVRRGGVLALVQPIPPATISFHATAIVHTARSVKLASLSKELESRLPRGRRDEGVIIELTPKGQFLTYGIGVSLMDMLKPEVAKAVTPVE